MNIYWICYVLATVLGLGNTTLEMTTSTPAWCLFLVGKQLIKKVNEEINQVISDHKVHEGNTRRPDERITNGREERRALHGALNLLWEDVSKNQKEEKSQSWETLGEDISGQREQHCQRQKARKSLSCSRIKTEASMSIKWGVGRKAIKDFIEEVSKGHRVGPL